MSQEGYPPVELRTRSAGVRAVSALQLSTRPAPGTGKRGVEVTATVTAPGVTEVTGQVRITHKGRTLRTLRLQAGTATAVVKGLPRGPRLLRAHLLRTDTLTSASARRTVRVR